MKRIIKNICFALVAAIIFSCFFACDSADNVSFISGVGEPCSAESIESAGFSGYTPDIMTHDENFSGFKDETAPQTMDFIIDGMQLQLNYSNSQYYRSKISHSYSKDGCFVEIDKDSKIVFFMTTDEDDPSEPEISAKQRYQRCIEVIGGLSDDNIEDCDCIEETKDGFYRYRFKKTVDGKYTNYHHTVSLFPSGKLRSYTTSNEITEQEVSQYPAFDSEDCYEQARAELFETFSQNSTKKFAYNASDEHHYIEVHDKLYYLYTFYFKADDNADEHYEDDSINTNNAKGYLEVYVELVIE